VIWGSEQVFADADLAMSLQFGSEVAQTPKANSIRSLSMKRRTLVILASLMVLAALSNHLLFAQEAAEEMPEYGWQNVLVGNLNFSQSAFDNWAQGGEDSLAWQLNINGKADRKEAKYDWANAGKLSYGMVKIGGLESRKSIDEIKAESVFTYILGVYVNPYVAASGETQLAPGYVYDDVSKEQVSDILDPGYFTQSAGLGYEPFKELKTRLGFALKETITRNYPAPYADDPETSEVEKTLIEPGIESVTDFSKSLIGGILLTSKLEIFSNFKAINEIDVKWDNIFSAKISKYIDVNLNIKLLYDRNISTKRQLKQSLSLGLTYTFL